MRIPFSSARVCCALLAPVLVVGLAAPTAWAQGADDPAQSEPVAELAAANDSVTVVKTYRAGDNITATLYSDGLMEFVGTGDMNNWSGAYGEPWHYEGKSVKTVVISEGITSIGDYAFGSNCGSLKSVSIPSTVISIGKSAFDGCYSLQRVNSPSLEAWFGITFAKGRGSNPCSNGADLFINGEKLVNLVVPEGMTSIPDDVFYGCSSLESIYVSDDVSSIGSGAFSACTSLQRVDASGLDSWLKIEFDGTGSNPCSNGADLYLGGDKLVDLDLPAGDAVSIDWAFAGCGSLKTAVVNSSVNSWKGTFYRCSSLESISLDRGLESVDDSSLRGCASLVSVQIPESVTSIGESAFEGCSSLKSISIPESVTSIGVAAFAWCTSLQSIVIPEGVDCIGEQMFRGCSSLESVSIPSSAARIEDWAFWDCSSLKSVAFPKGVTEICLCAFMGCSSLSSVTIPYGMKRIGDNAFYGCESMEAMTFEGDMPEFAYCAFFECAPFTGYYPAGLASWANPDQYGGKVDWVGLPSASWEADDNLRFVGSDGKALTGWFQADTDCNGQATPGAWYFADDAGQVQRGSWYRDSKGWCYTDPDTGMMWTDHWASDSAGPCYIGGEGYCLTGWFQADRDCNGQATPGAWYFANDAGQVQRGSWHQDSKGWCYTDPDTGMMWADRWGSDTAGPCYIGPEGYCLAGWFQADTDCNGDATPGVDGTGAWYFADGEGRIQRGTWSQDSQGWCYTDPQTGEMWASKWIRDSVGWCYIGHEGYCLTGWFQAPVDRNGNATPGTDGQGAWYFADGEGRVQCGNWYQDSKGWCYTDPNTGEMWASKWIRDSVAWCFIGTKGYCLTSTQTIDTADGQPNNPGPGTYTFDANGRIM